MKIKSLKHNFIMYALRILSGILFTLIVFPYIARTLGPLYLGKVQFAQSIVAYFILFINLGIPTYGKREIAFVREDRDKRSKLVLELLIILGVSTIIVSLIYFFLVFNLTYLRDYRVILYIFSIQLLLNFLEVEWFYFGIENQEYITKRSLIVRLISSIIIYLLVKEKNDYIVYTIILVFSLMGSNVLNFKKMFEYVTFKKEMLRKIELKVHINPIMVLFLTSVATTVFSNFDSIMVKMLIDDQSLGYYSIANKLGRMPLMITTAIFTVFYPRLCNLINKKEYLEYYKLGNQGLDLSLILAIPSTIMVYILSPEIIKLLAGDQFLPAINTLKVFSFLITVMAIAVFTGNNLVIHLKEKIFMRGQVIASLNNIIFNLIFIPILGVVGAAIGTIIAETTAIIYRLLKGREIFKEFSLVDKNKLKILISSILMGIVVIVLKKVLNFSLPLNLLFLMLAGGIFYIASLIAFKERYLASYLREKKIKRL